MTTQDLIQCIHIGKLFNVYKIWYNNQYCALKIPAQKPTSNLYVGSASMYFSRLFSLECHTGEIYEPNGANIPSPVAMLRHEHQRIKYTQKRWNHSTTFLENINLNDIDSPGLLSPFWEGGHWADCSLEEQRTLFPQLLPSLWKALSFMIHGDLQPSNIVFNLAKTKFALIDPGSLLIDARDHGGSDYTSNIYFTTNRTFYPVIPPYFRVEHLQYETHQLIGAFIEQINTQNGTQILQTLECNRNMATPHPADTIALGIMYYIALSGRHPWYLGHNNIPVWEKSSITSHFQKPVDERLLMGIDLLNSPIKPPSHYNSSISAAENNLALALLMNQITSYEELMQYLYHM